jgi:hypothetical protein
MSLNTAFRMRELRKLERFDLKLPARINIPPHSGKTLDLITENVCAGGAYFLTRDPLTEGLKVLVDLVLKRERDQENLARVTVAGKVLRTEPNGMAVRFDKQYQISPAV